MATAKVVIASEWLFTEPNEVRTFFKQTDIGRDKNIEYDVGNHQFVVDCAVFETRSVAAKLQSILQKYIDDQEDLPEHLDDIGEVSKIQPISQAEFRTTEQDHIWDIVDRLEAQAAAIDVSSSHQLIPQVTQYKDSKLSAAEIQLAFSKIILSEISHATTCQVELELGEHVNRVKVIGSTDETVNQALALLDHAEDQYQKNALVMSFDFFDDEGHVEPTLRLNPPMTIVDTGLVSGKTAPVSEVMMVDWNPTSRQYRIIRKHPVGLDHGNLSESLWGRQLTFAFTDEQNNPVNGLKQSGDRGYGELSMPQQGRTERWVEQTVGQALNTIEDIAQESKLPPAHRKTVRVLKKALPKKIPAKESQRNIFDERVQKDDSDDSSVVDFQPLQRPTSKPSLVDNKQWPYIRAAFLSVMQKALHLHKRNLAFEVHLGRAYVYTTTVKNERYRPKKDYSGRTFGHRDWPGIFRIKPLQPGSMTLFSQKLTQSALDAEFLLNMKLKGGENLFEAKPKHRRAFFEITCKDLTSGVEAVIELVDRNAETSVEGASETIGSINLHFPNRTADCSWQLFARRSALPAEQEAVFASFQEHAFVSHYDDGRDPELFTMRHEGVRIMAIKLIRETVHRARGGLSLVLSHVKLLEHQTMGERLFKAYTLPDDEPTDEIHAWWEAKLVSIAVQRLLQENRDLELGGQATWDQESTVPVLQNMFEMAQHIVPKLDHVGFVQHGPRLDKSSQSKSVSKEQATSVS